MSKYDELIAWEESQIGYTEGKNNQNKYGEAYGMDNEPYCMIFQQEAHKAIGKPLPVKTASCGALYEWYKVNRPQDIVDKPFPGVMVIFEWRKKNAKTGKITITRHVGLVKKDGNKLNTIEANTSPDDTGSQNNGDGVYAKTRSKTNILAYIDGIGEGGDTMTDQEIYEAYNRYAKKLPLKLGAKTKAEFDEAVKLGITDGTNPNAATPLWRAAVMCKRVFEKAKK